VRPLQLWKLLLLLLLLAVAWRVVSSDGSNGRIRHNASHVGRQQPHHLSCSGRHIRSRQHGCRFLAATAAAGVRLACKLLLLLLL
jgi:hypothetical protein